MKKLLLSALAVLIATGAVALSVQHYHKYQNQQAHNTAIAAQKHADDIAKVKADAKVETDRLRGIAEATRVECDKGAAAYAQLTPAVKAKLAAPVCPTAIPNE